MKLALAAKHSAQIVADAQLAELVHVENKIMFDPNDPSTCNPCDCDCNPTCEEDCEMENKE